jgi:hypothetical protein
MHPARSWKKPARAFALLVVASACLGTSVVVETPAAAAPLAQATPRPAPTPAARPAPRAGGFPIELALPLLAGGGAAIGGGVLLLRRGRKA